MKLSFVLLLFCCYGLFAQGTSSDKSIQVIRVKSDAVALCSLVKVPGMDCQGDRALRAVVVKRFSNGSATDVENAARAIRELDNLGTASDAKTVELTTSVIAGSTQRIPDTQEVAGDALVPVLKQLRATFPYTSYQVLSTMLLRVTEGDAPHTLRGSMKWLPPASSGARSAVEYSLIYGGVTISPDSSIHLNEVRFESVVPVADIVTGKDGSKSSAVSPQNLQIRTRIDLREGQKVVVGSATVADVDVCLFLVLSGRLVQ